MVGDGGSARMPTWVAAAHVVLAAGLVAAAAFIWTSWDVPAALQPCRSSQGFEGLCQGLKVFVLLTFGLAASLAALMTGLLLRSLRDPGRVGLVVLDAVLAVALATWLVSSLMELQYDLRPRMSAAAWQGVAWSILTPLASLAVTVAGLVGLVRWRRQARLPRAQAREGQDGP